LSYLTGRSCEELLREEIEYFAGLGIEISGTAAHGSPFARHGHDYINYELFAECDPRQAHIYVERDAPPVYGRTIGDDLFSFRLNSVKMKDFGLKYEAYFVGPCVYIADIASGLSVRWRLPDGRDFVEEMPDLGVAIVKRGFAESGHRAVQLLVHPDHWRITGDDIEFSSSTAIVVGARAGEKLHGLAKTGKPSSLPFDYLSRFLFGLANRADASPLKYDDLELGAEQPCEEPSIRIENEFAAFNLTLKNGTRDRSKSFYLMQYLAGGDPASVNRVLTLHRELNLPYSLAAPVRWLDPSSGVVEDYPLDWDAIGEDVRRGIGSVGYLANALDIAAGDASNARSIFAEDVDTMRGRDLQCRYMTTPIRSKAAMETDWWKGNSTAPLWIWKRFKLRFASRYDDAALTKSTVSHDELDPVAWVAANLRPGKRVLINIDPRHYGDNWYSRRPARDCSWINAARDRAAFSMR
ncbi:MAG TPA: hypothetical protein VFW00_11120, partial [Rhodocyclaceae bacterium]|nr:hypothetical protein [Rhodocyclaceae bacterium]